MIIDRSNDTSNIKTEPGFDVVNKFVYMGLLITTDGSCGYQLQEEIKSRLAMTRSATTKLIRIWKDQTIIQKQ